VLVPAAVQGVINGDNAARIRPRMLVEGGNATTTLEADEILAGNGVIIVPDVLANAGSVHLCQMERTQGLYDNYWDLQTVDRERQQRLVDAYRAALNAAAKYGVESARLGAWINATKRIEEAIITRGWI